MDFTLVHGEFLEQTADLGVVFVHREARETHPHIVAVDRSMEGYLLRFMKQEGFDAGFGERLVIPAFGKSTIKKFLLIGLGEKKLVKKDMIRRVGALMVKCLKDARAKRVVVNIASLTSSDEERVAQLFGEGVFLASYEFREHFGAGESKKSGKRVEGICLVEADKKIVKAIQKGIDSARAISEAVHFSRDLVNRSPRHMHPSVMAESAKALVQKGNGVSCRVMDKEQMKKMGMEAALAVGEGSAFDPVCIHLIYRPKKSVKQKIAIVGKGVTFDSGGLSIKPADSMVTMKSDMAGAATVLGLFKMLPLMDIRFEVHGIVIAVENMPSGTAYRPGDVVRAMNGMTIEILNTDAEGRVTLADALSYAVKKVKPDQIIDLATLTGAAIIALGEDCAPFMCNDRNLGKALAKAARRSGELFWELPLISHYDEALQSKVADMNNTGGRPAGAIKGGLFLQRFVGKIPWAHLDIAGPSFSEKEYRPDLPVGGTGFGVRTLVEYLQGE